MKKKYLLSIVLIGLVLLIFTNCKTTNIISNDINYESKLTEEEEFQFRYQFFEANNFYLKGQYALSVSTFNECLKLDPFSSATHYKLASIYLYLKDYSLAEEHAQKAALYNPENVWYLYLAGNIYLQNEKFEKARETFKKLIVLDDRQLDFYLNLADVYLKENDLNGALTVYTQIENVFGVSEIISLQKHKLYMAQNKPKEALKELIILSESNSSNIEYKRLIADFYVKIKDFELAEEYYNTILEINPNDGFTHIGLAECYRAQGNFDKSISELKLAFVSTDVESDVKFNLLISIIQNGGDDIKIQNASFELTELLLKMYPDDTNVNTIYANFLMQAKEYEKARQIIIKVLELKKDKYALWEQLILLDNQFLNWEEMYSHSNEALQYFPNQSFLYFFNGFSAFQLSKFTEAVNSLSFGYKLITKDDPLGKDFLTFLGESYYKIGNKEKCYETFDKLIEIDKENLMILNNYAYYLSEDNLNLDKAAKMSKITIDKEPNNSTYLDTYAWILFKQKNYIDALEYIKKAIEYDKEPSDIVLEHYGDILYHNNFIEEALIQWKKAIKLGKGSGLLENKIEKQLYFE